MSAISPARAGTTVSPQTSSRAATRRQSATPCSLASAPGELRLALLDEGARAFLVVAAPLEDALPEALEVAAGVEVDVHALVEHQLAEPERQRRLRREQLGERHRLGQQL